MAGRGRRLGPAVALAGLGALVLAAPVLRERVAGQGAAAPSVAAVAGESEAATPPLRPAPGAARPVAPEVVAPPPVAPQVLERVEAREPLSPIGRAHAPSEGPPKETILHRPLVVAAGEFGSGGYRVVLAGVRPTPAGETCGRGDASWPCGVHARTAFRNRLRGRALACVVPPAPPAAPVTTPCRLGGQDAGAWLVGQGWARADPADPRYAALEEEARKAGRGLHGAAPAALAPFSVTVPEAGADPAADGDPPPPGPASAHPSGADPSGG